MSPNQVPQCQQKITVTLTFLAIPLLCCEVFPNAIQTFVLADKQNTTIDKTSSCSNRDDISTERFPTTHTRWHNQSRDEHIRTPHPVYHTFTFNILQLGRRKFFLPPWNVHDGLSTKAREPTEKRMFGCCCHKSWNRKSCHFYHHTQQNVTLPNLNQADNLKAATTSFKMIRSDHHKIASLNACGEFSNIWFLQTKVPV